MTTNKKEQPKLTVLDTVNNYFYMHQEQAIKASDLKSLMLEIGSPVKSAVQQIGLLVKRGDAVCVRPGGGQRASTYKATPSIKFITESKRTRVFERRVGLMDDFKTPEGVLMLQNIVMKVQHV